ncbi:MAG: DUF2802 domain-containing protein [Deltaproteobacteria bacterium]|nr:DUF2802 domain-containing protein [Deltaproteobacteria bacterium]
MFYWGIALLAIDAALLAGILYVIIVRGGVKLSGTALNRQGGIDSPYKSEAALLMEEMKKEFFGIRKNAAELERKWVDLDGYERIFDDRLKKIDSAIKKSEDHRREAASRPASAHPASGDAYSRAVRLLENGISAEEVIERLGLLKGEAELITALNSYKC